jgi:hypothetical protein
MLFQYPKMQRTREIFPGSFSLASKVFVSRPRDVKWGAAITCTSYAADFHIEAIFANSLAKI